MPAILPRPGVMGDQPRITSDPYYAHSVNVRWRSADGMGETLGFVTQCKTTSNAQIVLDGPNVHRSVLISPCALSGLEGGQILSGSSSHLNVLTYDPASLPSPGTRWQKADITPAGFDTVPDTLPSPATGAIEVPPNVQFEPLDDIVVILKANDIGSEPWIWDRDPANVATALGGAPKGAVGMAVVKRILVLLGAQSVGETGQDDPPVAPLPDFPARYLTVRWCQQYNFENWNQSDTTTGGELQLDHGARIVGGGRVRQGIAVWTDEALEILTYSTDLEVVFSPKTVAGSGGLLANQAWCETEGRLWYLDTNRRLVVYDGGAPRPIPNPSKLTTIERLSPQQAGRCQMFAYPEFDEVVVSFPVSDDADPDFQMVYNYGLDVWYSWYIPRAAWTQRKIGIDAVAIGHSNAVFFHDIDAGIGDPYLLPAGYTPPVGSSIATLTSAPDEADVEPMTFAVFTNPFTSGEVTTKSFRQTRLHWDRIATPAANLAQPDQITVHATGFGISQIEGADVTSDAVIVEAGELAADIRTGGKAIQLGLSGDGIKTQIRFGAFSATMGADGTR